MRKEWSANLAPALSRDAGPASHPGLIGLEPGLALEILGHRDATRRPRFGKVLILEGVVEVSEPT